MPVAGITYPLTFNMLSSFKNSSKLRQQPCLHFYYSVIVLIKCVPCPHASLHSVPDAVPVTCSNTHF